MFLDVAQHKKLCLPIDRESAPPFIPLRNRPVMGGSCSWASEVLHPNRRASFASKLAGAPRDVLGVASNRGRDVGHRTVLLLAPKSPQPLVDVPGMPESIVVLEAVLDTASPILREHRQHGAAPVPESRGRRVASTMRLPSHEHELAPLHAVGFHRVGHQVAKEQTDHFVVVSRCLLKHCQVAARPLGLAHRSRRVLRRLGCLTGGRLGRRRCTGARCSGAGRRSARPEQRTLNEAGCVLPALVSPCWIAERRGEAEVLFEDDEEAIVVHPRVQSERDQHVLRHAPLQHISQAAA